MGTFQNIPAKEEKTYHIHTGSTGVVQFKLPLGKKLPQRKRQASSLLLGYPYYTKIASKNTPSPFRANVSKQGRAHHERPA